MWIIGRSLFFGVFLCAFLTHPVSEAASARKVIAGATLATVITVGSCSYYFLAPSSDNNVSVSLSEVASSDNKVELFANRERQHFFSTRPIYGTLPSGEFNKDTKLKQNISRAINKRLHEKTPKALKHFIDPNAEAIKIEVEGLLIRKRGQRLEALLVAPFGQYWFPNKFTLDELLSGKVITLEVSDVENHKLAVGKHTTKLRFRYDRETGEMLIEMLEISLELEVFKMKQKPSHISFQNIKMVVAGDYTERPEIGAYEQDDEQD